MSERLAVAGLWAIPGVGPMTLTLMREKVELSELANARIGEWVEELPLNKVAQKAAPRDRTLADVGAEMLERAKRAGISVAWLGDYEYPFKLRGIRDAPPLLFYMGPGATADPRRRVAIVGKRNVDGEFETTAKKLVEGIAEAGIGVVSGAARGVDSWAHRYSAYAKGETWAFVGSGLDQLDRHPAELWRDLAPYGATFFSEFPPGMRADPQTFPRRNRLISGAADAVLVLRASIPSGCRHTVEYAQEQGRPVFAMPGDKDFLHVQYCNYLVARQGAGVIYTADDLKLALRVSPKPSHKPRPPTVPGVPLASLSEQARAVHTHLEQGTLSFDDLAVDLAMMPATLISALGELELSGHVIQFGARRYQRLS